MSYQSKIVINLSDLTEDPDVYKVILETLLIICDRQIKENNEPKQTKKKVLK